MHRWWAAALLMIVFAFGALLWLATQPDFDPLAYSPPARPPLAGALEPNRLLQEIELLGEGELESPEDVAVDMVGRVYCGLEDGTVRRLDPEEPDSRIEVFADTGGRPLGLDFDAAGTLWVADSKIGLLSIDQTGEIKVRSTVAAGIPVGFANDVAAAASGKIYFSDASTRFGQRELMLEALEARPHGRLLEHDPASGHTRVLLDDLFFANGVALGPDEYSVLVAETFRYRIRRHWLVGPQSGSNEIFTDNLAGFPDGLASDDRGRLWAALYGLRSDLLDRLVHPRPWLKRLIVRLPWAAQSGTAPYGLVLALDADGHIVRSLHDPGGRRFAFVTSVEPHAGSLYLGSIESRSVGRWRLR